MEQSMQGLFRRSPFDDDVYQVKVFFGWCKLFPPKPKVSSTSKGIFRKTIEPTAVQVARFQFPLIDHENKCGEWKATDLYRGGE
jgi:hypothetical protein